ncbi:MAG TPA: glycosyltransferase, partial [Nitrososphaera sp.]
MFGIEVFLYIIFVSVAWILTLYTLNFYYLFYRSGHNSKHKRYRYTLDQFRQTVLPNVTIQLPFYNEKYVALRAINAVCNLDYPKDKMQIQILDDSDDSTGELIRAVVENYRDKGFDVAYHHRGKDRPGYKAGALNDGMKSLKGDFVAIFDADFVPSTSFLRDVLIHFYDPRVGFVQCKWAHFNENYSSLTAAQAI